MRRRRRGHRAELDERVLRAYLGGVGWARCCCTGWARRGSTAQAPPAFVFSPLAGSPLTTSAEFAVVAKSPLTGLLTAPLQPDETEHIGGLAVTSAARTVADLARTVPFEQAVVLADAALQRGMATSAQLAAAAARAFGWAGAPRARRVIAFADGRSESVGESRSRVLIARTSSANFW